MLFPNSQPIPPNRFLSSRFLSSRFLPGRFLTTQTFLQTLRPSHALHRVRQIPLQRPTARHLRLTRHQHSAPIVPPSLQLAIRSLLHAKPVSR